MSSETRNIVSPPKLDTSKKIFSPLKQNKLFSHIFPHFNYFSPFLSRIDKDNPIRRSIENICKRE